MSQPDPWKSFRGIMAGTLILEVIAVLLALPVLAAVGGGLTGWSLAYILGFAVLLVLLAGMQRRPWAIWANLGAQLLLLPGFFIYPAIGIMGVVFAVVWGVIAYLGFEVRRRQREQHFNALQPDLIQIELDDTLAHVDEAIAALEAHGYQGWYVLEQDCALTDGIPPEGEGPITDVRTSLAYLDRLSAS